MRSGRTTNRPAVPLNTVYRQEETLDLWQSVIVGVASVGGVLAIFLKYGGPLFRFIKAVFSTMHFKELERQVAKLREENERLREENDQFRDRSPERERYELRMLGRPDAPVYVEKETAAQDMDAAAKLCANCFDSGQLSYLYFEGKTVSYGILSCPRCQAKVHYPIRPDKSTKVPVRFKRRPR